jgi:eukaryotic-like serine/threonine-protein kinase
MKPWSSYRRRRARRSCIYLTREPLLISDVLALFDAGAAAPNGWITRPVRGALADLSQPAPSVGAVLGVWRIKAEIGEGGMGRVFLVERCDGHFEQIAALKLLKGLPSAERLAYFSRERQLLAKLTHPNIARLYDGGTTSNGQPYLVMEYVEGLHVDQYCQATRLGRDGVLKIFIEACHGVAFAHRQLIVHCDIKPSNLLIDKESRPILLDFGIARLSDPTAPSEPSKSNSAQAFTPRYASPEQREGTAVSTLSDIYSLGLLLAELLDLAQGRDRELAAIIANASHVEPSQRYPSVDVLIDDLKRYQQRLPLRAVPASSRYVAGKFLRRRWPLVLAGLAFLCTVAGFTAKVMIESQRALRAEQTALQERDRAQQAESAAKQTSDFLISVFDSSNPNAESGDIPASKLIAAAEARVDKEMRGQPATQADLFSALGVVQSNMGQPKAARANLERALALERTLNRPLVLAEMLARLHRVVSGIDSAANSEAYAKEALALREQYAPGDSPELAESLVAMARTASALGRREEAGNMFMRALAILENKSPDSVRLAEAYALYAGHLNVNSEPTRALDYFQRCFKIKAKIYGELHPSYLETYEWYAYTLTSLRRFDEAEAALRRALRLRIELHGADNYLVAGVMRGLATLLIDTDRPREAIPLLNEAMVIVARSQGKMSMAYAVFAANLAKANNSIGDYAGAERVSAEALEIANRISNNRPPPALLNNHALYQMRVGKLEAAGRSFFSAYDMRLAQFGAKHNATIESHLSIAEWYLRADRLDEASARLDQIAALLPTSNPLDQLAYDRHRAMIAAGKGNIDAAIAALEKVEQARFKVRGEHSALAWLGMIDRADVLAKRGTPADKLQSAGIARQILAQISPTFDASSPVIVRLKQMQGR